MGGELQPDRLPGRTAGRFLDLAGVAVTHHAIGRHRFAGLGQQQVLLGGSAPAGGAGLGINDDAAGFNQALAEKRHQRQQAGRGETAGGRHQPRSGDRVPFPLHQAVHRFFAQGVVVARMLLGFGRIHAFPLAQGAVAVVGGEIHHLHPAGQQIGHQARRQTVGQAQHRQIRFGGDRIGFRHAHHQIPGQRQKRGDRIPARAGAAFSPQKRDLQVGMIVQQPQALQTAIATGADHGHAPGWFCRSHAVAIGRGKRTGRPVISPRSAGALVENEG